MSNGLFIAEGLITIKDEESRTFSIVIININDCDVNLCDNTLLSTAEIIEVLKSHVVCKGFGKEIRDNVNKFLKKHVSQGDILKKYVLQGDIHKKDVSQGDILKKYIVSKSNCKDREIKKYTRSLQACVQEKLNNERDQDKCLQNGEKKVSQKTYVAYKQNELLRWHGEISAYQKTLLKYIKSLNTSGANTASGSGSEVFTDKPLC